MQEVLDAVFRIVGKWALAVICTIALVGFGAGAWATKQDVRTSALEAKAQEASIWREMYDKRQRRIESLVVQMAQKAGIDTSRIED